MQTEEIKRMDDLIKSFLDFQYKLEDKNPGICVFIYKNPKEKVLRTKCELHYFNNQFIDFTMALTDLRSLWMSSINTYAKSKLELT